MEDEHKLTRVELAVRASISCFFFLCIKVHSAVLCLSNDFVASLGPETGIY